MDVAIIIALIGSIWKVASWKTSIEKDMDYLKNRMIEVEKEIDCLGRQRVEKAKSVQNSKDDEKNSLAVVGMIGLINEKLARERKSSYGVKYFLNYNICEINEAYDKWDKIGYIPYLGHFVEIENTYNNLKTWCMVIGSFNDNENPNRILVLSKKAANSIVFKKCKGLLPVKVRLLDKTDWKANKDCVYLYDSVYMLEKHE